MVIRRNNPHDSFEFKIQPIEDSNKEITADKINQYEIKKQINRSKTGFPRTELLEAGGVQQWIQLRTEQLLNDSDSNRMHLGLSQLLGLSVGVGSFLLTGTAIAPLAPIAITLGLAGYVASIADSAMNLKRLLPIPFSGFTIQKLAISISADARQELSGYDDTDPDRYNKLAFLSVEKAKELEMIIDYQGMLLEILDSVPEGKKFAIYYVLRQAAIEGGFGDNSKAIASEINKFKDKTKVDSTLDYELVGYIKQQINFSYDDVLDLDSTTPKTFTEKLSYRLPMDEVRREQLLENTQNDSQDLIPTIAKNLTNMIICSPGGGGKGIVISNALREVKKQYKDLKIFYLDPKGDTKEFGYYRNVVDYFDSFDAAQISNPKLAVERYEKFFKKYDEYEGKKLIVIDECTTLGIDYDNAGKIKILKARLSKIPSLGGSRFRFAWIVCQNAHVSDLGINTGILAQYPRLGILCSKKGDAVAAFDSMKKTSFLGTEHKYIWDDVRVLCDNSPRDRAFYYSKFDEWLPMPELTNYSGYDRDTDSFISNQDTIIQSEQFTVIQDESTKIKPIINELKKQKSSNLLESIKKVQPDLTNDEIKVIKTKLIDAAVFTQDKEFLTKFGIIR